MKKNKYQSYYSNAYQIGICEALPPQISMKKGFMTTNSRKPLIFMVGTTRFELVTSTVSG